MPQMQTVSAAIRAALLEREARAKAMAARAVARDWRLGRLAFAFETPIANNFGVSANYTYADGHDQDGHVLRGNVKNSFTVGGFFENDQFSARINYGYNSDHFLGRDRGTHSFQRGVGVLSASVGYKLNDHFAVSLDAQNLNDPVLKYYGVCIQALNRFLDPIRERRAELERNPRIVEEVIAAGSERTRKEAAVTLRIMKDAMGLGYFG